ncbi:MAG TPA: sugar transferase [Ferruginibacter sp.]|nr:sugar transferase [Ferruginibacter sp.]HRO16740.1 sugar transferase [Ferruginibacter sp.]HRQ19817.1 sugar transferase [Ferruginibacter sp.]
MYPFIKRLLDIILSATALCVLMPLLVPVILILLFTGEREVFYLQKRIGYKNRPFYIWKFATMLKNSPNIGTGEITLRNDPRVTPFGKVLRLTKINELPQIVNVLKGDMSIVGPRPLMEVSFVLYPEDVRQQIYQVPPGITGIASLVFRDEEKLLSDAKDPKVMYQSIYPYKAALEMWYQRNKSLSTDIKIIFLTAWLILFPQSDILRTCFKDLPAAPRNS